LDDSIGDTTTVSLVPQHPEDAEQHDSEPSSANAIFPYCSFILFFISDCLLITFSLLGKLYKSVRVKE
jgi:hypothetical protein